MASDVGCLPPVWDVLTKEGEEASLTGLLNVWKNRLRTATLREDSKPQVVLAVTPMRMTNLIPQDAVHPLYLPAYFDLTDAVILDHLCEDPLDEADPAIGSEKGLVLKTMSGKDMVFKKEEQSGKMTANGVEVETLKRLSDGTAAVVLKDFLFDHFQDTQKAFRKISEETTNQFCPLKS